MMTLTKEYILMGYSFWENLGREILNILKVCFLEYTLSFATIEIINLFTTQPQLSRIVTKYIIFLD